mgnify:CR=1 FL=1
MIEGTKPSILRFMTCGSVDDGKSTLIGHLLYLTGNVFEDQYQTLLSESKRIGHAGDRVDYSLLMDGLIAEREQGITIDVAYKYFNLKDRKCIVADTPGHTEYTRNMATAASNCTAAVILIDARLGVVEQTRRHTLICSLCGIQHILFAVNKMDLADWSISRFMEIQSLCKQIIDDLKPFDLRPEWQAVPVSALWGDNIVSSSENMRWYTGVTIAQWLTTIPAYSAGADSGFRFSVQYIIKPGIGKERWQKEALDEFIPEKNGNYRSYAGRILSGKIKKGDTVLILPSKQESKVVNILKEKKQLESADEGMSVSLVLSDKIDVSRGTSIIRQGDFQECSDQFKAWIVWMQKEPLIAGRMYLFQSIYGIALAEITRIRNRIDLFTFLHLEAERFEVNDIGEVEMALNRVVPFDPYRKNKYSGGFLLIDRKTNATAGCGMVIHALRRAENVHWQHFSVDKKARAQLKNQKPVLLWFTGLSGSGKSTIADLLEKKLYSMGKHTMVLDGDNVRHGLCKDLGFTEQDRTENIRRVGEVAKLMVDAGLIVLACFISPYKADREMVRSLFDPGEFVEVYVRAPLKVCEQRDPKGLYKKARKGEIPNFTGINAPYEEPDKPEIVVDTLELTPEKCVNEILVKSGL